MRRLRILPDETEEMMPELPTVVECKTVLDLPKGQPMHLYQTASIEGATALFARRGRKIPRVVYHYRGYYYFPTEVSTRG